VQDTSGYLYETRAHDGSRASLDCLRARIVIDPGADRAALALLDADYSPSRRDTRGARHRESGHGWSAA